MQISMICHLLSQTWQRIILFMISGIPCLLTLLHRLCITIKRCLKKAEITEIPDSLEAIEKVGDQLLNKGGAGEVISLGIYGWFFEQFMGKQGLDYANNGNGRTEALQR